jgi:hypothetical protein
MQPSPGPTLSESALAEALREALPAEHRPRAPELAAQLVLLLGRSGAAAAGEIGAPVAAALRAMAGRELRAGDSLLSFASAQTGDVTISGDIAGRDLISLNVALPKRQVITEERRYSCLGLSLVAMTSTRTIVSLALLLGLLVSAHVSSFTAINSGIVPTAIATATPAVLPTPAPPQIDPPGADAVALALPLAIVVLGAVLLLALVGRLLLAVRRPRRWPWGSPGRR